MARTNEEASIEEEVRNEFRELARKNRKSQALIPYNPDDKEFWEQHSILSHMVDLLKLRGENVGSGQRLRVIMTMDDGEPTLFLQGEERRTVVRILERVRTARSLISEEETDFLNELLERVS